MADLGNFTKNRIEAFSDGLFAIVVTLLVVEVRFPHIDHAENWEVWRGIVSALPKLMIWMISFLTVCVVWMNHHRVMEMFRSVDGGLFWMNNILLMFTSLIPFPTMVIGDYPLSAVAACFYGLCMAVASLAFSCLRLYVHGHKELLKPEVNFLVFKKGTRLSLIYGPLFYSLGAAASWLSTYLAFAIYFFLAVYFILPRATRTR